MSSNNKRLSPFSASCPHPDPTMSCYPPPPLPSSSRPWPPSGPSLSPSAPPSHLSLDYPKHRTLLVSTPMFPHPHISYVRILVSIMYDTCLPTVESAFGSSDPRRKSSKFQNRKDRV